MTKAQSSRELKRDGSRGRGSLLLRLHAFSALILCSLLPRPLPAQENKVIVKNFHWGVYATEHFDIHYYDKSREWLPYTAGVLEKAYKTVSADLNPAMNKRIPFFLFASMNDMQQSNVTDTGDGVGGVTEPFKDRFMVWSDGSEGWLKDVITHEFAHEAQFSVLIDGFWKSARILKTFIYPLWMMEGIAEYETGGADLALENMYLRDASLSAGGLIPLVRLMQFAHLKPHQTTLAYKTGGQAIRFLAAQYGKDKPARMLELFKSRYDASSVMLPLIGLDLPSFDRKFREYTELKYLAEAKDERLAEPERYGARLTGGRDGIPEFNTSPALSPDGKRLAYLSTREGHPPVLLIKDLASGKVLKAAVPRESGGTENIPYGRFTKPWRSLAWSGDGKYLAFSGQKNHREYIFLYDPVKRKIVRLALPDLMEARQPVFSPDSSKIMFVGMLNGFNDLYELALTPELLSAGEARLEALRRVTDGRRDEASPYYLPDGSGAVYSCEAEGPAGPRRELCRTLFSGAADTLASAAAGDIYDPVVSPDGRKALFVSDAEGRFELYELDLAGGGVSRLTRVIGGNFTPAYSADGKKTLFSSFRNGGMDIYAGAAAEFLREPVPPALFRVNAAAPPARAASSGPAGEFRPYKFKASPHLFFPVLMFSSPGGLFWMNYWQASDMLGNHNLALMSDYSSANKYLSYQAGYSYARYRMPLLLQVSGLQLGDNFTEDDLEYDRRDRRYAAGTAWPFDRYNRMEGYYFRRDTDYEFDGTGETDRFRSRGAQVSYIRDTVSGLYLTAVRGSRTGLSYVRAGDAFGGTDKYDAYTASRLQYFPLSKRSAFVDRFVAGQSAGRDKRRFDFGGLGGLRGFSSTAERYTASKLLMNNLELRVPIFKDVNYYMWYMFPDFYFKAVYAKVFVDSAYGWDRGSQLRSFSAGDIDNSVGAGIDVHTFLLQAFRLVLSFDCAVRTRDGGKIFYFYLGPMF